MSSQETPKTAPQAPQPKNRGGRPRVRPEGSVTRSYSLDRRAHDAISAYAQQEWLTRSEAASKLVLLGVDRLRAVTGR